MADILTDITRRHDILVGRDLPVVCSLSFGVLERYLVAHKSPIQLFMYNRILGRSELRRILPNSAAAVGLSHNGRSIVEGVCG